MRIVGAIFLVVSTTLFTCGCGKKATKLTMHPVTGRVLYAGEPANGVRVYFMPTTAPAVPLIPSNPHGVTGPDGRFTLTTLSEGDGAAVGGYQVILLWPLASKNTRAEMDEDRLLGWYSGVHSTLKAEVKEGDNIIPPFELDPVSRPPEELQGIPGKN